jgi:hypothetical protein
MPEKPTNGDRSMSKWFGARVLAAVAVTALVAAACSDGMPTGLQSTRTSANGLLSSTTSSLTSLLVAPVNRTTPLPADVVWSFTAGPGGAVSSNSSVGLTVTIPSGALSSPTTITVTALAGAPVAYQFEPHLVFNKKVTLRQSLQGTSAGLLNQLLLKGAHFATDGLVVSPSGLVAVTEIVPAVVNILNRSVSFDVQHFTGWLVASGYDGGNE